MRISLLINDISKIKEALTKCKGLEHGYRCEMSSYKRKKSLACCVWGGGEKWDR